MKKALPIVLAVAIITLSACGGGSSSKDLFSLWNDVNTAQPLDLRGASFEPFVLAQYADDGSQCNCVVTLIGEQSSGTWVRNFCTYVVGSGPRDPGCNSLNDTGTYKKSSDQLQIVDSSGTSFVYR